MGVFIGDNGASCMSALEEAVDHRIVKQSDVNHSKKGVGNHLYEIKADQKIDVYQELNNENR